MHISHLHLSRIKSGQIFMNDKARAGETTDARVPLQPDQCHSLDARGSAPSSEGTHAHTTHKSAEARIPLD